jgi:penicillin-binding protein 2
LSQPESTPPRIRLNIYRALLCGVFLILVVQLWRLQMMQGEYYQEAADINRFRLEEISAPRGVIYDRQGHLLARNMPQLVVSVIPAYLPEDEAQRRKLLFRLGDLLDMPMTSPPPVREARGEILPAVEPEAKGGPGILDIVSEAEAAPYRPALVKEDIPREVAMILEEEHLDWPGILVQAEPVREYLYGSLLSHALGYIGPIPEEQADAYEADGYDPNRHLVGLTGIESAFERDLHGRDGQKLIEVDVAGREVRTVGEPQETVPGYNLRLTIDLNLQQAVEDILQQQLTALHKSQAVAIAMNPQTGEILAMVSLPSYDNNEFTGGISTEALQALHENLDRPW